MLNQVRYVLFPFSKWRDLYRKDIETVKQILPELSICD